MNTVLAFAVGGILAMCGVLAWLLALGTNGIQAGGSGRRSCRI